MKSEKKPKDTAPLIPVKTSDESDERESSDSSRDAEIVRDTPPHYG
ncbi:MAG: hypothetical protein F2519_01410 [Actinobacteria bacterium]|nr:hypothetical protein [Actinomycetota bacterium]MSW14422.1 hypothetical protein [Actinomycetota bacterium]MSW99062.1 hypothetical protein [Actinomycetota bacterium]MSY82263.1 hypothetical protein [Actinomycetota bacterium]MSZ46234.1 hypothetical protein [Actinomycetota bacterium]